MSSLLEAAAPKSDQLNACDFLVAPKTYTIKDVVVKKDGEQRVSVFFEDCKLPWKPCKSMLRVMMVVWDSYDSKDFIGKSLTLYNDEKVMWAGVAVGGIRISHMSGLIEERTISLRATKKAAISYVVKPLLNTNTQINSVSQVEQNKGEPANSARVLGTEQEERYRARLIEIGTNLKNGQLSSTRALDLLLRVKDDAAIDQVVLDAEIISRLNLRINEKINEEEAAEI
jgi:hypothetical protein